MKRETHLDLVAEAARAPSVHNAQPARWRFLPVRRLCLVADERRRLSVGDPTGRDHRVSLGAAFEGMAIALARRGMELQDPVLLWDGPEMATAEFREGATQDPLGPFVFRRSTWRGRFLPATESQRHRLRDRLGRRHDVVVIEERQALVDVVRLADKTAAQALEDPGYFEELCRWTRLSRSHPDWDRDGLNADALLLSPLERLWGPALMRPARHAWLKRLGLLRSIAAESTQGRTATALLLLTTSRGEDLFHAGRAFYRVWLEACAEGFSLCPMSSLADSPWAVETLVSRFAIPSDRVLVNVFRVGVPPRAGWDRLTARLPAQELLID